MSITRAAANRQNAKASTGPRTPAGKGRAARNAIRHGLAVPVSALAEFDARILRLADLVAGTNANPSRLEAARRIAEAIIDIGRVHSVRLAILDGTTVPHRRPSGAEAKALIARAKQGIEGDVGAIAKISALQEKMQAPSETTDAADRVLSRMLDAMPELARLDRYERRARSRRKFAIRDLDALGASEGTHNGAKDG